MIHFSAMRVECETFFVAREKKPSLAIRLFRAEIWLLCMQMFRFLRAYRILARVRTWKHLDVASQQPPPPPPPTTTAAAAAPATATIYHTAITVVFCIMSIYTMSINRPACQEHQRHIEEWFSAPGQVNPSYKYTTLASIAPV